MTETPKAMIEIIDCQQGGDEWRRIRAGIPTASKFSNVMAEGKLKTRTKYLYQLAGERLTGEPMESYSNSHMERGKVMEDEARALYCFLTGNEVKQVGFIRNGNVGCSPDSLIGANGTLEIKTKIPDLQIEALLAGELPAEHAKQVQGQLWVAEREWADFMSYWPKMPPLLVRVYRDETAIKAIAAAVSKFNDDLDALVERLTNWKPNQLEQQLTESLKRAAAASSAVAR